MTLATLYVPKISSWRQHAAAYAAMKWPALAAHSRASVAEALATVTPAPDPGHASPPAGSPVNWAAVDGYWRGQGDTFATTLAPTIRATRQLTRKPL